MSKVIIFSTKFPAYHKRAGEPTLFVEKLFASYADVIGEWKMPKEFTNYDFHEYYNAKGKHHTIRGGTRFSAGDKFSPRIWSGKPYRSKQIILSEDIEVKKVFDIKINKQAYKGMSMLKILIGENNYSEIHYDTNTIFEWFGQVNTLAQNDGLTLEDFRYWFDNIKEIFTGQIICWNDKIKY